MSIDALIFAALSPLVDGAVYPDVAPEKAPTPRIVYQQVGGAGLSYTEGSLPDNENCRIQVVTWGLRRLDVTALAKLAEAAILIHPGMQATTLGGRVSTHEESTNLYGARQDFSVWAPR